MAHFGFPVETIVIFILVIILSVYMDLHAHRKTQVISFKDSVHWTLFWIALAIGFYVYLWLRFDKQWADLYLAGYALEKSLSIDNLMVFIAIFASFGIKSHLQHKILYWGIIGALVFRAIFVVIGTSLFMASPWVGFVFAAFVAWSGIKMLQHKGSAEEIHHFDDHWSVRLTGKLFPIFPRHHKEQFFITHSEIDQIGGESLVTQAGKYYATPAFLCLIAIETSDVAFAFDSVPAVISVTEEPLLVYAAMIFAILGLRSLYFVLEALNRYMVHLEKSVIALLFFIAAKLTLQSWNHALPQNATNFHISPSVSLAVVIGILALGVVASLLFPGKPREPAQ